MEQIDPEFEALLLYLKETRGFDFTGYKRSSVMRRVDRRMSQVNVADYRDYVDYLQVNPDEFTALFNTILINVTGFFRDPDAWDYLRAEAVEPLVRRIDAKSPIRAWSAGCASGEEAYTLAMVLAEVLGAEEFRRRVKIYATDVDEEGLSYARHGAYTEREIAGVPAELVPRYFERQGERFVFRKDLRRAVIFGRNDLVQDAPISRADLLVCRNTLMYLNAETQGRILSRFHFALGDRGVLFLGKAEMLLSHTHLFFPTDLKRRVFSKLPRKPTTDGSQPAESAAKDDRLVVSGLDLLRAEALTAGPVAQVVVTADGLVALTNRQAETMFGVTAKDVGRPFHELDLSYRPVELRRSIDQAKIERRTVRIGGVDYARSPTERLNLEVQLIPLVDGNSALLGVVLSFHDVTEAHRLHNELGDANRQLETAYEELQSTNEELETTNEELQSTVEELETTNEELQSTNEELETMNEELHSTNDELQSINDLLQESSRRLDELNAFLGTVLTTLRAAVVVINQELKIMVWTRRAEDLWGIRGDEAVGQHFLNLDIGLPTEALRPVLRQALAGTDEPAVLSVAAVNRRGRPVTVRVVCSSLRGADSTITGAVLVMEPGEVDSPALSTSTAQTH